MKSKQIFPFVILLLFILSVLSACSKAEDNKEFPDVTATEYTVMGTLKYKLPIPDKDSIVSWPFGSASIEAVVNNDSLVAGLLVADGTFTLVLPGSLPGKYFSSLAGVADYQGGTLKASPETIRIMGSLQFRVKYTDKGIAKSIIVQQYKLKSDNSIDKSYFYNFYDTDGTFTGTGSTGNIFNWVFTKGWGMVESNKIAAGSQAFNSKSVSSALQGAVWVNY